MTKDDLDDLDDQHAFAHNFVEPSAPSADSPIGLSLTEDAVECAVEECRECDNTSSEEIVSGDTELRQLASENISVRLIHDSDRNDLSRSEIAYTPLAFDL